MLGKSAALLVSLSLFAAPALAQDMRTASENVVACQTIEDGAARLECFETAAAALSVILAAPVPQVAEAPPQEVQAPVAMAEATTPSPSTPTTPPISTPTATTNEPMPVQMASATETATETDVPESRLPSWIPRISFGNRDVEKEPDEFRTTITRIQRNKIGRHFFTTAEGQVWRQRQIGEIRAPKTLPAEAVLSQNITGGIRLKIVETNRTYNVGRVE
ncbi:MAG: hypothetical protein AAFR82_07255 [Pseudomonadota bacterium]